MNEPHPPSQSRILSANSISVVCTPSRDLKLCQGRSSKTSAQIGLHMPFCSPRCGQQTFIPVEFCVFWQTISKNDMVKFREQHLGISYPIRSLSSYLCFLSGPWSLLLFYWQAFGTGRPKVKFGPSRCARQRGVYNRSYATDLTRIYTYWLSGASRFVPVLSSSNGVSMGSQNPTYSIRIPSSSLQKFSSAGIFVGSGTGAFFESFLGDRSGELSDNSMTFGSRRGWRSSSLSSELEL